MQTQVGLVTCVRKPEPDVDETLMLEAFADAGLSAAMIAWDDPSVVPGGFKMCVLRSCWNYHESPQAFEGWLKNADGTTQLQNPLSVLLWNLDKRYLLELAGAGVPIVPTHWIDSKEALAIERLMDQPGWRDVVIKPTLSAGSANTQRFGNASQARVFCEKLSATKQLMVQPYLSSVETEGEASIVVIAGNPTHKVTKAPRFVRDDESVSQSQPVSRAEAKFAARALDALPVQQPPLYARVDLMRDAAGNLLLSELELLEPSLFFKQEPSALTEFVQAIGARLDAGAAARYST